MNQNNRIKIRRPKTETGHLYMSAVTVDSAGAVTPVFYEDWLKKAYRCGWKKLSQENTNTELTETWELKREPIQNKGGE